MTARRNSGETYAPTFDMMDTFELIDMDRFEE